MKTVTNVEPIVFVGRYLWAVPRPDRLYRRWRMQRERSGLGNQQIRDVLSDYGLALMRAHAASTSPGRSMSIVVDTPAGMKLLKRYASSIEPEAIVHEHSILRHLQEAGFPAPRLTLTKRGASFVSRDRGMYALFDYLDGYVQYHNCLFIPSQTRAFIAASAKALALLHLALEDFVPDGINPDGFESRESERWKDLGWFSRNLQQFRDHASRGKIPGVDARNRDLLDGADWIADRLHQLEHVLQLASPPRLIIHGDYGPYNLLFKQDAAVVVLDFERARLDWRLTDLSTALGRFAASRAGFDFGKMKAFLHAYREIYPVAREELSLLPTVWLYLTLRQLISCCARFLASHEVALLAKARQKLDLADWLQGHERSLSRVLYSL